MARRTSFLRNGKTRVKRFMKKKDARILVYLVAALLLFNFFVFVPKVVSEMSITGNSVFKENVENSSVIEQEDEREESTESEQEGTIEDELEEPIEEQTQEPTPLSEKCSPLRLDLCESSSLCQIIGRGYWYDSKCNSSPRKVETTNEKLSIASWNLVDFGESEDEELVASVEDVISEYDIIFLQGIKDEGRFEELCDSLSDKKCEISDEQSGEMHGLIYDDEINLDDFEEFNSDDKWQRAPIKAVFDFEGYEFIAYSMRAKESEVQEELEFLEELVDEESDIGKDRIIVLGSFFADCEHYDNSEEDEFESEWNWVVGDNDDTFVDSEECAYDRIILNDEIEKELKSDGIEEDIDEDIFEHYPVWVEIEFEVEN